LKQLFLSNRGFFSPGCTAIESFKAVVIAIPVGRAEYAVRTRAFRIFRGQPDSVLVTAIGVRIPGTGGEVAVARRRHDSGDVPTTAASSHVISVPVTVVKKTLVEKVSKTFANALCAKINLTCKRDRLKTNSYSRFTCFGVGLLTLTKFC